MFDHLLIQEEKTELEYRYGLSQQLANAPVDRHLRDLLQSQQVAGRVRAAGQIGELGYQQFELDILEHVAKVDLSLQVRAAARQAILQITARLE